MANFTPLTGGGYILSNLNVTIPSLGDAMLVVGNDGNIGSKKIIHGTFNISTFISPSLIMGYKVLSGVVPNGSCVYANVLKSTQTPYSSVQELVVTPVTDNRFEIYAYGSGFVSGHILYISYLVVGNDT